MLAADSNEERAVRSEIPVPLRSAKHDSLPIKVAFVDQIGDVPGGAQRSLQLLLNHLPPDIDPTVILLADGAFASELRGNGLNVRIVPLPSAILEIKREAVPLGATIGAIRAIFRIRRAIISCGADIVYTNTVKSHFLALFAARLAFKKCAAHLRDILEGGGRLGLSAVLRFTTRRQVAISDAVAKTYGLQSTLVVPNPLDLNRFRTKFDRREARKRLGIETEAPLVGIVGRINRWKGHDNFLRIAAIVAAKSNAHFAIIGSAVFRDADFVEELRALGSELGLDGRLHFIPWMDDPRDGYASLDVHCNTSHAEPFGRSIIEAAALGVPTICFRDGGAPEAIAPLLKNDIVPVDDIDAFANAVLRYVLDPDLCERSGNIAADFTSAFDPHVHADRVAEVLRGIAGPKSRVHR